MSGLVTALAEASKRPVSVRCSIGVIISKLDDVDKKALHNAFAAELTGEQIGAALRSEGHMVQGQTVQRHRTGRCSCDAS